MKTHGSQQGVALLMLVFILTLIITAYLIYSLDGVAINNVKNKQTAQVLAQAKAALLGYATVQDLAPGVCTTNCPRPGDLPCPDTNNDGIAEISCGNAAGTTGQTSRLGRLPWKTLGLPDLRDGDGERLWYAVSSRYKYSTRYRPLNSDTLATISLRDNSGNLIFDGTTNGVAAVVIAPGATLLRQDAISQTRNGANQNIASNYLDVALGEDNQNFVDGNTDGFIIGPVKDMAGETIVNDQLLPISREEINQAMEIRVLAEVKNSLVAYYAGPGLQSYPNPADFNDATCLGNGDISANCSEGLSIRGRIPARPAAWGSTSILRGGNLSNWFQLNAWREMLYYAVAPACITGTTNCAGPGGLLTLNNSLVIPANNKQFVIITAGAGLTGQARATTANKSNESNYLEGENVLPLDDVYTRTMPITTIINDRAVSLP